VRAPATQPTTNNLPREATVTDNIQTGRSERQTMREIVLDTETTGLDPLDGRIMTISATLAE